MLELLTAYLTLGALAALARGRWRVSDLSRTTLLWPVHIPELLRGDPSPVDPPALQQWSVRITAAVGSLQTAIDRGHLLGNEDAGRTLLIDTRRDLLAVARRHAELDEVLADPQFDLAEAPTGHTEPEHIERLHQARSALEHQLEEGMAEVMSLAARLHLAGATGAPVRAVSDDLQALADAVGGVEEAEAPDRRTTYRAQAGALEEALRQDPPELPVLRAHPRSSAAGGPGTRHRPQPPADSVPRESWNARMMMVAAIMALTLGSLFYRILGTGGLEQSSALFIGLPALLAMVVALLPAGRSFTGMILKIITLMLLLSGIALAEGLICIAMAAPLFYAVGFIIGATLDWLRLRSRAQRMVVLVPFALLSMEGVHPDLSLPRQEAVTVQRVVAGSPDSVRARLAAPLAFPETLPFLLRLGFPRPVQALGHGLSPGDRRVVHLAGGEGNPGNLVLEVAEADADHVVFAAVSDSSHVAHWLSWQEAEVQWVERAPGQTEVRWTLRYRRDLDPALWFGPVQRHVVAMTAGYLMDCLLPPEVPDADT